MACAGPLGEPDFAADRRGADFREGVMAGRMGGLLYRYITLLVFKRRTLGRTTEQMASDRGAATFLHFADRQISFSDFNKGANRRANLFQAVGVQRGETVALMMENRPEFLETLTGLAKLGAVTAAIDTNLTGAALVHCLTISGAKRVIVGRECLQRLNDVLPQIPALRTDGIFVDTASESGAQAPAGCHDLDSMLSGASTENPPAVKLGSDDLMMYIYTSGTTGMPKAARITHLRWFSAGYAMGYYGLTLTRDDVVYCALPLYHSNGALIAFGSAMVNGCTLALSRRFSASRYWEEATKMGATTFIYIGEVLRYLMSAAPGPYDRAHKITRILGNGLRPDIWTPFQQRFGIPHIREFYASTEGNAATLNMDDTPASVGRPILKSMHLPLVRFDIETEHYVMDAAGFHVRCGPGEVGELLGEIKGTSKFDGYTNTADTEKKLLRNVFKTGDLYFKTGDLMKMDAAGNHFFVDRMGDTFRWKGENVSTQEVQEILSSYPGVQLINVFGVQVPGSEGRVGMAAILFDSGSSFAPDAFFRYAEEKLPSYARPGFVRVVHDLELTGTYKLKKTDLQKAGFDPAQVKDPLYYRDEAKKAFAPVTPQVFSAFQAQSIRL
jgi:fatty-acyl-CoA synthase